MTLTRPVNSIDLLGAFPRICRFRTFIHPGVEDKSVDLGRRRRFNHPHDTDDNVPMTNRVIRSEYKND
jgi:hypothetical protein